MGWAIASIALGVVIVVTARRIVGWMGAADDEPLTRESRRLLPAWVTRSREVQLRTAWVCLIGLIFVGMGVSALVTG